MNRLNPFEVNTLQRLACIATAVVLLLLGVPILTGGHAGATQFTNRSIKLSDASPSGTTITTGVGSGTNVTYRVSMTTFTQAGSLVIDFCSNDALIGDTCSAVTGIDFSTATLTAVTGNIGGTGWTITASGGQVQLADDGVALHDATPGAQVFDISGVTNPSVVGSFFARMYTFSGNTYGTYVDAATPGNFVDFGGVAMSINNVITITARVSEQLTFCVTKAPPSSWNTNHDCSDPVVGSPTNYPALILGHGSPTAVLDSSAVDTANVYTQLSTNATYGAVVNMRNSNLTCGGLSADGGTTCAIPAINAGSGLGASAMVAGTSAFGMYVTNGTQDVGGIGAITASTAYHDPAHTTVPTDVFYGMDTTTSNNNVTSTFGSTVASTSTPVYRIDNAYTFAATAALTTPAGIYTANLSLIATGTF